MSWLDGTSDQQIDPDYGDPVDVCEECGEEYPSDTYCRPCARAIRVNPALCAEPIPQDLVDQLHSSLESLERMAEELQKLPFARKQA